MRNGEGKTSVITIIWVFFAGFLSFFPSTLHSQPKDEIFQQFFADRRSEIEKISNNPELMKKYILIQENLNIRDKDGKTLLHYAAQKGYLDIVKLLLERGADINAKDIDGKIPLHYAVLYHGTADFIIFLIEKGANFNWLIPDYGARDKDKA